MMKPTEWYHKSEPYLIGVFGECVQTLLGRHLPHFHLAIRAAVFVLLEGFQYTTKITCLKQSVHCPDWNWPPAPRMCAQTWCPPVSREPRHTSLCDRHPSLYIFYNTLTECWVVLTCNQFLRVRAEAERSDRHGVALQCVHQFLGCHVEYWNSIW